MKVKTAYKAGETITTGSVMNSLRDAGQQAAQKVSEAWQKVLPTLSNPKFWTWPF